MILTIWVNSLKAVVISGKFQLAGWEIKTVLLPTEFITLYILDFPYVFNMGFTHENMFIAKEMV